MKNRSCAPEDLLSYQCAKLPICIHGYSTF
jgi:hypothetical protein